MSIEAATLKAVHDALQGDSALTAMIGGRVYDRVPANVQPAYPYVVVAVDVSDDANTCSNASESHATVRIYSNAVGQKEAYLIGGEVRRILAPDDPDDTLDITGYLVSVARFDVATYRAASDPLVTEGVLVFTYLVDPASVT